MSLPITAFYTGLLTLIVLVLSFRVGSSRGKTKVSLGDGGNVELLERVRAHGNATEYIPLAIFLLAFMELKGLSATWLHVYGALLVVARIAHPIGLKADYMAHPLRAVGAAGTVLPMLAASVYVVFIGVKGMM